VNAAVSVTSLAGITGSASGGMSIALAAMSDQFIARRRGAHSAGSDAPRGGHGQRRHGHPAAQRRRHHPAGGDRPDAPQSYRDIFGITIIKTLAVFFVIAVYY
jgi:hypothetical protein